MVSKALTSLSLINATGTNVTEARRILDSSGMLIETADNLEDAAIKAVAAFN